MAEPVPLPIACTLTGTSLQERGEWLRRLGEAAGPPEAAPVLDTLLGELRSGSLKQAQSG